MITFLDLDSRIGVFMIRQQCIPVFYVQTIIRRNNVIKLKLNEFKTLREKKDLMKEEPVCNKHFAVLTN